jgi:Xaa-Pro aminopeptidase
VHDVFDRTRPFEPGMVVTLEPGIYVRRADVEASELFRALEPADQASIRAALDRYDGLGVRIEDDLLITDGAPEVLSDGLPRTPEEIEAFFAAQTAGE